MKKLATNIGCLLMAAFLIWLLASWINVIATSASTLTAGAAEWNAFKILVEVFR